MIIVKIFQCLKETVVLFNVAVGLAWQLLYSLSPINKSGVCLFQAPF